MGRLLENLSGNLPEDLDIAVALGLIPKMSIFSVWNEKPSVSTSQEEMSNIASGVRVLPTSGGQLTVASSSANDAAAGTGARTLLVTYLDTNLEIQQEVITLNGTSNVLSVATDVYRLRNVLVTTVGSGLATAGNITLSLGGNPQARILAGQNEYRETGFTVPADTFFLSTNAVISVGRAGSVDVDVAFEYRLVDSDVWYTVRSLQVYQNTSIFGVVGVAALPAGTDLRVLATASGGSGPSAYVQVRGYEIEYQADILRK